MLQVTIRQLILIFRYLDDNDIFNCAVVCKAWNWNQWRLSDKIEVWLKRVLPVISKWPFVQTTLKELDRAGKLTCDSLEETSEKMKMIYEIAEENRRDYAIACIKESKRMNVHRYPTDFVLHKKAKSGRFTTYTVRNHAYVPFFQVTHTYPDDTEDSKLMSPHPMPYLLQSKEVKASKGFIFINGIFEYHGEMYRNEMYPGTWVRHGYGQSYFEDALDYEGQWAANAKHGYGTAYHSDGRTVLCKGEFIRGVYVEHNWFDKTGDKVPNFPEVATLWSRLHCKCTFEYGRLNQYQQLTFHCETCTSDYDVGICETCAITCHDGHQVKCKGMTKFYCDCGSGNAECTARL